MVIELPLLLAAPLTGGVTLALVGHRRAAAEINVAFGCVGGRHRSVWCASRAAAIMSAMPGVSVTLNHTELDRV